MHAVTRTRQRTTATPKSQPSTRMVGKTLSDRLWTGCVPSPHPPTPTPTQPLPAPDTHIHRNYLVFDPTPSGSSPDVAFSASWIPCSRGRTRHCPWRRRSTAGWQWPVTRRAEASWLPSSVQRAAYEGHGTGQAVLSRQQPPTMQGHQTRSSCSRSRALHLRSEASLRQRRAAHLP